MSISTVAIVCYCPSCNYFLKTAVQIDAIGSHLCTDCGGQMEVYIAQGQREVVQWHRGGKVNVAESANVGCGAPMGTSGYLKCYCGMVGVPLCRKCKALSDAQQTPDDPHIGAKGEV